MNQTSPKTHIGHWTPKWPPISQRGIGWCYNFGQKEENGDSPPPSSRTKKARSSPASWLATATAAFLVTCFWHFSSYTACRLLLCLLDCCGRNTVLQRYKQSLFNMKKTITQRREKARRAYTVRRPTGIYFFTTQYDSARYCSDTWIKTSRTGTNGTLMSQVARSR